MGAERPGRRARSGPGFTAGPPRGVVGCNSHASIMENCFLDNLQLISYSLLQHPSQASVAAQPNLVAHETLTSCVR